MQTLLNQLIQDHQHFNTLLDRLEHMPEESGPLPNDELESMLSTVKELLHDQVHEHHALEDTALEALKSRHRISDLLIESIEQDHKRLNVASEKMTCMVQQALKDVAICSLTEIRRYLFEFTKIYRDHIRTEEEVIFPMIEELIGEHKTELAGR